MFEIANCMLCVLTVTEHLTICLFVAGLEGNDLKTKAFGVGLKLDRITDACVNYLSRVRIVWYWFVIYLKVFFTNEMSS